MNVGALIQERERLLAAIEESKVAKHKLRQVNVLIAMYGDTDNIALIDESIDWKHCAKCDRNFKGNTGIGIHNRLVHGKKGVTARKVVA
jgi:hypothetical protein